jgi:hypothetical protein
MNVKRFLGAAFVLFIFFFAYEWLVHGYLLMNYYLDTPQVWRGFYEMRENFPLHILFELVLALWLAFAFAKIYKTGGVENGLKFGLFFGVFAGLLTASWYLWLPVSVAVGAAWLLSSIIQGVLGGLILGGIYHSKK